MSSHALDIPSAELAAECCPDEPTREGSLSRRMLFKRALAAAAAGTFLYTWRVEPHWVEIVERPLPIVGLGDQLVGRRLVQLSDLHAGPIVDQSFLLSSLERVGELKPDLLVVTGDFMTCQRGEELERAFEVVRALPPAPLGRFAIHGNHDYGDDCRQIGVAGRLADGIERLGVQMLRNEVATIDGLQIVGVDEILSGLARPEAALSQLDATRPSLALLHNPDGVDHPAWGDYQGWVLSGHTHGGQCKAPLLPPPVVPVRNRRYVAGEYEVGPGRRLYINRGLGYLRRVRFNCRPEITVFTLQRAAA